VAGAFSDAVGCWLTCVVVAVDSAAFSVVAAAVVLAVAAAGTGFNLSAFLMIDLLCLADNTAKLKQVKKNIMANVVVALVRKTLVFGPNMDSTLEKLSSSPPPLPAWIKIIIIKSTQAIT